MVEKNVSNEVRLVKKAVFADMYKRAKAYLDNPKNKNSPLKKVFLKSGTNGEYVTYERFRDMWKRANRWKDTYNAWPDNVYILYPTVKQSVGCAKVPRYATSDIKQANNYFCGPNVAQQIIYDLTGKFYDEITLAKKFGTINPSGTDPENLRKGIISVLKGLGYNNATATYYSLKGAGGWVALAKNMIAPKESFAIYDKYKEEWWHYEFPVEICTNAKTITIANSLSGGYIDKRTFSRVEKEMSYTGNRSVLIVKI